MDVAESLESSHQKKVAAKRDENIDNRVKNYLRRVLDIDIPEEQSLGELLHDGTVLCRIVNAKYPNMIRGVKPSKLAMVQRENISKFLAALSRFGVPEGELFSTIDLHEEKDMQTVAISLESLSERWPTLDPPTAS